MTEIEAMGQDFSCHDQAFMAAALQLARRAEELGEVPVGAVLVKEDQLISEGWNSNIALSDPSAHAEIMALRQAGKVLGNYRFPGCTVYVTLEPCAMCVGAMIHARINRVVFAASDPKTGALGGTYDLQDIQSHNHRLATAGGLMAQEASAMLQSFFRQRRLQAP